MAKKSKHKMRFLEKNCIYLILFGMSMFFFNYLNATDMGYQKSIYIKGKLGSEKDQVGEKITNNYDVLPSSMTVDSTGNIYLADHVNNRIQKFDEHGKHLLSIMFEGKKEKLSLNVDDMTIDPQSNLVAVSGRQMSIYRYDSYGKIVQTINYSEKKLQWDDFRKDWSSGYVQVERIKIDSEGNIYLKGIDQLVKFNSSGNVLKKWIGDFPFVIDENDNLYLMRKGAIIEKYDESGNLLGKGNCTAYFPSSNNSTCYLPQFIDKDGFIYWFEQINPTSTNMNMFVVKANSNRKVFQRIPFGFIPDNTVKFDPQGNIYALNSSKTEFWIEKYSWDKE